MEFKGALDILTKKFNQYKAYREAHPEFTNPPAFVLALGAASGPTYIKPIVDCMLGGVQNPDGSFGLEPYTSERSRRKCVWFCISMDQYYDQRDLYIKQYIKIHEQFNISPYKVAITDQLEQINKKYKNVIENVHMSSKPTILKNVLIETLETKQEKEIKQAIDSVQEPVTIVPVSYGERKTTDYIFTDGNEYFGLVPSRMPKYPGGFEVYQDQEKPNFYNLVEVSENYKMTSMDDLALTKHRALRKKPLPPQPMVDIVIGTNCSLARSPMNQFQTICKEIIDMGGFCFVYNDAFFHEKGSWLNPNTKEYIRTDYLENYYFENMCDIPMFFQQFPIDRVFRIENTGGVTVHPLLESIPRDDSLKKYNPDYRSYGGKIRSKHRRRSSMKKHRRRTTTKKQQK
jgi:hypothetical protein